MVNFGGFARELLPIITGRRVFAICRPTVGSPVSNIGRARLGGIHTRDRICRLGRVGPDYEVDRLNQIV